MELGFFNSSAIITINAWSIATINAGSIVPANICSVKSRCCSTNAIVADYGNDAYSNIRLSTKQWNCSSYSTTHDALATTFPPSATRATKNAWQYEA